ncbi:hypothetical protein EWM64_g5544 [Hericium alpestre]|uniref:Uncharacterized protein n=1 Tax=Hericium alpestre TaxID=135208 RepID=A0A4Y9ZY97_9AGAM|nr:hypothetical protein EWM64_g5544 [Hericium alpestre]
MPPRKCQHQKAPQAIHITDDEDEQAGSSSRYMTVTVPRRCRPKAKVVHIKDVARDAVNTTQAGSPSTDASASASALADSNFDDAMSVDISKYAIAAAANGMQICHCTDYGSGTALIMSVMC